MGKKVFVIMVSLVLVFSIGACRKKESEKRLPQVPVQPVPQGTTQLPQMPMQPTPQTPQSPLQPSPPSPMQRPITIGETKVVVPTSVKGKWSAVKLVVENKTKHESKEYTINLNSDFKVPSTDLKIHVGDFLPDFKMSGLTLTSSSNEPNNPAVAVRVFEGKKQIFPAQGRKWAWLFAKMPSVHPLSHPKYSIHLKEGIPKKG